MDATLRREFADLWARHFPGSELPLAFFFSGDPAGAAVVPPPKGWRCFVPALAPARRGRAIAFGVESLGCEGAKQYAGFIRDRSPDLELFLSCGEPGGREGLRLKRTPELVHESEARAPWAPAAGRYLVAKRWDRLGDADEPAVIAFFVRPDALAGLVTLSCFDRPDDDGTASPFLAGCGSIFGRAWAERREERPRCFAGVFDFTPRRYMRPDELTFSVPFGRFREMVANLPESFAITAGWRQVIRRRGARRR